MMNKEQTIRSLNKLFNFLLVKKYPNYFNKVDILNISEYKTDVVVNIIIHVTEKATIKAFNEQDEFGVDMIFDDINEFVQSGEDFEDIIGYMLDINIYDELNSILSYVIVDKEPFASYELTAPHIDEV